MKRYTRLNKLSVDYKASLFWEQILADFKQSSKDMPLDKMDSSLIVQSLNKLPQMGYCFEELDSSTSDIRADRDYIRAISPISRWQAIRKKAGLVSKEQWEHQVALQVLRRADLMEEYEKFILPLRVKSSMSVARHFFYKRQIYNLVDQSIGARPLNVLEIGAGAGNLAYFLYISGIVNNYCIVDLPEMLLVSAFTIQKYLPEVEIVFEEGLQATGPLPGNRFIFVPAQYLEMLPHSTFDICLNIGSFQEMDELTRDNYINKFYEAAKKNALFFNMNRRQTHLPQPDGSYFDNNPLRYPYRPNDRVLLWEECEFHELARKLFNQNTSLAISRAAIINPL